jgi:hypothetical protein
MNPDPQHWTPREKVIFVDLKKILFDSTRTRKITIHFLKIYVQQSWIFSLMG